MQSKEDFPDKDYPEGHNPCFNRITFAIIVDESILRSLNCHNPCFNRITFAMRRQNGWIYGKQVTILVLIE